MCADYADPTCRAPAVAGMFYPDDVQQIQTMVKRWSTFEHGTPHAWHAALVPHAGWIYSGRIATEVLAHVAFPETVVLICPKHHPGGADWAVAPWSRWLIPGGRVDADLQLSHELVERVADFQLDQRPHLAEHAIEVQLPIIANLAPHARIVAITVGRADLIDLDRVAAAVADVIRTRLQSILFIISSDMNHFADEMETHRLDALALGEITRRDPDALYITCQRHGISMCGLLPAVLVMKTLQQLDALHQVVQVDYATSADASRNSDRVVGYAGLLFN